MQRQVGPEEEEEVQTKLQRQTEEEEESIQTKLQRQAEEEEEEPVQAKQAGNQKPAFNSNIESSVNSLKGGGQPLPESTRSYFEPRFGADFSQVRVHTDSQAAETAKSINAKAFTKGKDVVFGTGQYSPRTSSGKRLLAHELTHVMQQSQLNSICLTKKSDIPSIQLSDNKPRPKTSTKSQSIGVIKIATIVYRKGDNPKSVMMRALVKYFKISKKQAKNLIDRKIVMIVSTWGWSGLKSGDKIPVYLRTKQIKQIQKKLGSHLGRGKGVKGKGSGRKTTGAGGNGLGLIKVPKWVITVLKVIDTIITIVSFITGAGIIVAALKALLKKLLKWAIKRAVKKAAKEAAERIAKESLKKVTKKAAREGLEEAVEKSTKEAVKKEIRKDVEKAVRKSLQKSMKGASRKEINKAVKELTKEISEEVSKKAAKQAAKKVIKEATKGYLSRARTLINANKAKIPLNKINNYTLDPNHPVGKHKAKIIKKYLGYDKNNSEQFIKQLRDGIIKNKGILGKSDEYGQRFTVYIKMKGPNGTAIVESGWIFKTGSKIPELTSAYIPPWAQKLAQRRVLK